MPGMWPELVGKYLYLGREKGRFINLEVPLF